MTRKKQISVVLPENLIIEMGQLAKKLALTKTTVIMEALKWYINIKQDEMEHKAAHPEKRIRPRVVWDSLPGEDSEPRMASVLLY